MIVPEELSDGSNFSDEKMDSRGSSVQQHLELRQSSIGDQAMMLQQKQKQQTYVAMLPQNKHPSNESVKLTSSGDRPRIATQNSLSSASVPSSQGFISGRLGSEPSPLQDQKLNQMQQQRQLNQALLLQQKQLSQMLQQQQNNQVLPMQQQTQVLQQQLDKMLELKQEHQNRMLQQKQTQVPPQQLQQLNQTLPLQQNQVQQQTHPHMQRMLTASNLLSKLNAMDQNLNTQLPSLEVNLMSPQQQQLMMNRQQMQNKVLIEQQTHIQQQKVQIEQQQRQIQQQRVQIEQQQQLQQIQQQLIGVPGNTMNMGNTRGIGGAGIPMKPISGMGSVVGPNIGSAINQSGGALAPAAVTMASKLMTAPMLGGPQQPGVGSLQIRPGSAAGVSMLGTSQMQRAAAMGPPKLMAGMNMYMIQQQQKMQLLHQQQQQLQQLQQQHQKTTSSLVSSSLVGSPSTIQMSQASPQQMGQRTPMSPQISGGAACPQLSLQNQQQETTSVLPAAVDLQFIYLLILLGSMLKLNP